MALDWKAIHSLNGSQASGFEELCAQLARAETPDGAKFHRKRSPDNVLTCANCRNSEMRYWRSLQRRNFLQ